MNPWNSNMAEAPKDRGMDFDILLYYPGRRVSGPVVLGYYCDGWRSSYTGDAIIGTPTKWCYIPEGYGK